jgi:flavin reductase (DIM6/NTAB) family NADH-FMN oxidoreductase RutF
VAAEVEEFRRVIGYFASGVTVITAQHGGASFGTTASAVSSLCLEPPMLLVCMNQASSTGQAIKETGAFAVNILDEDHCDLASRFATKGAAKFEGVDVVVGPHGQLLLAGALAQLECRVRETVPSGTHWVFLAEVDHVAAADGAPLAYFRGQFGRLETAHDQALCRDLRTLVLGEEVEAGCRLEPQRLAETLGVPRGAVYHALVKLSGEGLVERRPEGEFIVAPVSLDLLSDAVSGRAVIEAGVASVSVGRLSPAELRELRRRMEASMPVAHTDPRRWVDAVTAFHDYLVSLGESEALLASYRGLNVGGIMARVYARIDGRCPETADRQRLIVEGYEAEDLEAVLRAIHRHADCVIDVAERRLRAA